MAVSVKTLREGQSYIFADRELKLLKLIDFDNQLHVIYEYRFDEDKIKLGQCPATEFAEKAFRDYRNDPEYQGLYPYVFVTHLEDPDREVELLNNPLIFNSQARPVKEVVKELVEVGYRPAYLGEKKGLFYGEKFISITHITEAGYRLAKYLSHIKDGQSKTINMPDFFI